MRQFNGDETIEGNQHGRPVFRENGAGVREQKWATLKIRCFPTNVLLCGDYLDWENDAAYEKLEGHDVDEQNAGAGVETILTEGAGEEEEQDNARDDADT